MDRYIDDEDILGDIINNKYPGSEQRFDNLNLQDIYYELPRTLYS